MSEAKVVLIRQKGRAEIEIDRSIYVRVPADMDTDNITLDQVDELMDGVDWMPDEVDLEELEPIDNDADDIEVDITTAEADEIGDADRIVDLPADLSDRIRKATGDKIISVFVPPPPKAVMDELFQEVELEDCRGRRLKLTREAPPTPRRRTKGSKS